MRTAVALFSVLPVATRPELTRADAVRAMRWLPLVGALLGALAALPLAAVVAWQPRAQLLGAALAMLLLTLLTRGLHLDGLADTADGLGSRAPAQRAREIMRRSDIGPFGVLAIVLALAIDTSALAVLDGPTWRPVAALALAAATGRLAAGHATHRRVPSAHPGGFGAYVAGSGNTPLLVISTAAVLGAGVGLAAATDAGSSGMLAWPLSQAGALLVAGLCCRHVVGRIGGVTGDVFGALIEITTACTLVGIALA